MGRMKVSVTERDFLMGRIRTEVIEQCNVWINKNCPSLLYFDNLPGDLFYVYHNEVSASGRLKNWLKTNVCGARDDARERRIRMIKPNREWYLARLEAGEIDVEYELTECMDSPRTTVVYDGYDKEVKRLQRIENRKFNKLWADAGEEAKELHAYIHDINKLLIKAAEGVYLTGDLASILEKFRTELAAL